MKNPLYALLVAPDTYMREEILLGKQQTTIREGHRDYRSGPVMLCCHIEPWAVMADIIYVGFPTLGRVKEEDYQDAGFSTKEEMVEGLRKFYPDITLESPVTVIRWRNVRGILVNNACSIEKNTKPPRYIEDM